VEIARSIRASITDRPVHLTTEDSRNVISLHPRDIQANWALGKEFDDEEKDFSGYALVDAAVGYNLPYGKVKLGVSNLLNKQYVTYYSQSASVDPDRYFAGRGRTATLGYSIDF
jgi:iron complex outermembrane receptor protein